MIAEPCFKMQKLEKLDTHTIISEPLDSHTSFILQPY